MHLSRLHPAWPLSHSRTAADSRGRRSVWLPRAWEGSALASLSARRCRTLQPEWKSNVFTWRRRSCSRRLPLWCKTMILISLLRFAYVAEQHGVLGPALLRAELLRRASVLRRHQLLWNGVAVNTGVTVLPPVFTQVVSEQELTAWTHRNK